MSTTFTGTVTFLFTDIEGSTTLWQDDSEAMARALSQHDELIRSVTSDRGGSVFKHTGDGMCILFQSATDALAAAIECQAGLQLPVRMGLHTGDAVARDGDYFGPTLNRAARVMDAGHGGQILLSSTTASLVSDVELVDLGEHMLKGLSAPERIHQVGLGRFAPLRTPRPTVGNLPIELSTFVGRVAEVESLAAEVGEHRLITLIGVGGTGKTRLAIETGLVCAGSFDAGCWLVELATVTIEEAVPLAFAGGLGVTTPPDGDVIEHVISRLRTKQCLIIVDNCEHVLAAAADVVERIVSSCPEVVVVATSREPLMVRGERLVPVASLTPEDSERLFIDRARDEAPDLLIEGEQRAAVVELCRRLDGLPLALELAASRVRALTPIELVENLEERFRLLVGGRRSRMERHQTMRGTLDWSYQLCREVEQTTFDRLSVFPAGFDLAAARAVAGGDGIDEFELVDVVPQLVDRSLLHRATAPDGTTRYRMLETMRAYGREHLQQADQADVIRERHARYMARTIAALTLQTLGPDEDDAVRRHGEHIPDALVALDWFIDRGDWDDAMRVAVEGQYVSERESVEMIARLHDAAKLANADQRLLDELQRSDLRVRHHESAEASVARGWRTIRARDPIPDDRFAMPPHADFNVFGLGADDVDEFVASLEHWKSAPALTRFDAEWWAIRSLANSGYIAPARALLDEFGPFVATLSSRRATRLAAELRGVIAMHCDDFAEAAHWYGVVVDATVGGLTTWVDLASAWHRMTARCLSDGPVSFSDAQLCDPWRCFFDEHLDVLRYHGAVSTALALHRLGHDELADRFVAWAYANDTLEVMGVFAHRLEVGGLPTTTVESLDDLPTLVEELFAFAEGLHVDDAPAAGAS